MLMLILTLALIGFVVWIVTTKIPMPPLFVTLIYVVVVVCVVLYLLRVLNIADVPVPRLR